MVVICQLKLIPNPSEFSRNDVITLESNSNRVALLLEANLRFLSANLQQNSVILNTLNNANALDENQSVLNNLLNWLKSLSQLTGLSQGEKILIEALKDSVRKAKSFEILTSNKTLLSSINDSIQSKESSQETESLQENKTILDKQSTLGVVSQHNEITQQEVTETQEADVESVETAFFYRMKEEQDRWEYISTIQAFITSYEHLMHLLIPNLVLEVVNELHRYDCQNKLIINDAISYPSVLFQNLVTKILREAPGSNLFRRIRRIKLDNEIDLLFEQAVNIGERKNIKSFVANYYDILTKFLDTNNASTMSLESLEERTKANFKQFSLGPASVEMRLTAVIKHITESAFTDAEEAIKNENASLKTKVIYLATTQLICDFQNFLLNEPRIVKFLEDLKS